MLDVFEACSNISDLLNDNKEVEARNNLILLLDKMNKQGIEYTSLINHLIRKTGLYPYMRQETSSWEDRFVQEVFKVNVGNNEFLTFHSEQSGVLKSLLKGESLAISAPTSFGKSFIIDAFIAIKQPKNVVIIVPTIALADETRRRLYKKFSSKYKIITTTDVKLSEKNIFIFPAERSCAYISVLDDIDILIIDEFYKASQDYDRERFASLQKVILEFGKKAKQRYYLSPNISSLKDCIFTKGMVFRKIDFNTVVLQSHNLYLEIKDDEELKKQKFLQILNKTDGKTLVYAGTFSEIDKLTNFLNNNIETKDENNLLNSFSLWLEKNYSSNWMLKDLVKQGIGIHTGRLHRPLSQIQVKLFEEDIGLKTIISTSSIIEGVNTSAENVVLWKNKKANINLDYFTYSNIIGRGGRMFKHFVGQIYILETPPLQVDSTLKLEIPDCLLPEVDEQDFIKDLSRDQIAKIIEKKNELGALFEVDDFTKFVKENPMQISDYDVIRQIVYDMKDDPGSWKGLCYLNSENPEKWARIIYKILKLCNLKWNAKFNVVVNCLKILPKNWELTTQEILTKLYNFNVDIDDFFNIERIVTFKLASLCKDINLIQKRILKEYNYDIAPFIARISSAFLPMVVYQLEEYGLPRMIAKKIDESGVFNFSENKLSLHETIERLKENKCLIFNIDSLDDFDKYILNYFYDGIQ